MPKKKIEKLLEKYSDYSPVDERCKRAEPELRRLSDKIGIPKSVEENSEFIYRRASEKNLVRGRSVAAVAAASVYAACRQNNIPRTLHEIAAVSLADKKDVARCYRMLLRENIVEVPEVDTFTYLSKIAEKTGISNVSQRRASQLLEEAKKHGYDKGKDPVGVSAAALYISCLLNNEKKTQKDIADAAGVTEMTVRNRYKTLKKDLGLN